MIRCALQFERDTAIWKMNCASTESAAVRRAKRISFLIQETRDVVVATPVHFEIPADNIERTKSSYSTLFDWEVKEIGWTLFLISRLVAADFL